VGKKTLCTIPWIYLFKEAPADNKVKMYARAPYVHSSINMKIIQTKVGGISSQGARPIDG
jgi:hypothetical protein